jgi:hypothetical protein
MNNLTEDQRQWIASDPIFPDTLVVRSLDDSSQLTYNILDRVDGRLYGLEKRCGFKGFVLKVQHPQTQLICAAKLAVAGDYRNRSPNEELTYSAKLRPAGALFVCADQVGHCSPPAGMPDAHEDFICFVAPWVEGRTLESLLGGGDIDANFACTVATQVFRAIIFLERVNLKHDDLHSGNIMIHPVARELVVLPEEENQLEVSVIDLGSLKPKDQTTQKSRDDWICFIQILVELFNKLHLNRLVASKYPYFMEQFRQLTEKLVDEDQTRYLPSASYILRDLDALKDYLLEDSDKLESRSFQPFEAISAEHLADDATLLDLFVETLPWMQDVQERKPIVLTGPRGCGKSMIFRYLAVRTHLGARAQGVRGGTPFDSFGVYISCATQLQNNLSWIARKSGRAQQLAHEISTYFQLVVARELLKSLGLAKADFVANRTFRLHEQGFDSLVGFICKYFNHSIESPRLTSLSRVLHFAEDLDIIRVQLHNCLLRDEQWEDKLPDTFLGDLTQKLGSIFPYFNSHQVVFLLDDYSSNRVQVDIQKILNKIVFERIHSHFFKISCEKFGFDPTDIDGVTLEETREFSTIDAGGMALVADDRSSLNFVEKLIDRRLEAAKWAGKASGLIGWSEPFKKDEDLAVHIRTNGSTQGRSYYYYGLNALARLWSGDTATILQIVREMFVQGGVNKDTKRKISKSIQHDAIVSISKAFKERVHGFHPLGPLMSGILGNYGSVARDVLIKGKLNNGGKPYRLYRIEMTKSEARPTIALLKELDPKLADFARELLRRTIFIELQDSRGKEGPATQTMRWELRRIFNPAFGLSLKRESYLGVKNLEEMGTFLSNTKVFCDRVRGSYAFNKNKDSHTLELFGEENE